MPRIVASLLFLIALSACAAERPAGAEAQVQALDQGQYIISLPAGPGETRGAVESRLLVRAARLAEALGHARFAVLDRRVEPAPGGTAVSPTFGVHIPLVRSKGRGRRAGSGAYSTIDLGGQRSYDVSLTIAPFDDTAPPGTEAVYEVRGLL